MTAAVTLLRVGLSTPLAYPSADDSERKLPADIEKGLHEYQHHAREKNSFSRHGGQSDTGQEPHGGNQTVFYAEDKIPEKDTDRISCIMAVCSARAAPDILLQSAEVGLDHLGEFFVFLCKSRMRMHLRKELQYLRYLILGAHVYFKIHFLPQVGNLSLPVLSDENCHGKEDRFQRDDHGEKAEGEGSNAAYPKNPLFQSIQTRKIFRSE